MSEALGFDFGRNPDRSMVMGIGGLALQLLGCLAGAVLAVLVLVMGVGMGALGAMQGM